MMNRLDLIKKIRQKLIIGKCSIGSWMQFSDSGVAEIMGDSGYDWIAIDLEHGPIDNHQLPDLFRALELGNTLPLVRLAVGSPTDCKKALDAGAGGVIVPMIKSAEQLRELRDACCWPPSGNRGVGFSRANLYGKYFNEYRQEAQSPILVAMIEDEIAFKNLDEILTVEGLDAILIGPYDLSASMRLTGEFDHPKFIEVMELILSKAKKAKIAAGIHVVDCYEDALRARINDGFTFIAYSIDAVMFRSVVVNPIGNSS
jgi:2-dehydro-3-deoxyglucarate aldolase